ncbi:YceI family protein [Aquimarina sp. U1-2]|uniref:YceI family protein n=1 Tax=Aquimarina sp. U1-2 TaxID=2823141 RepID=UPI001AECD417|nr:YceI family protein [Aquimarina sp. U1-2]MBP2834182.1 YceI family protein [Aquimarina sp. U1-2]
MRINLLTTLSIVSISVTMIACKGEKQNQTEATTAEEVIEAPATAVTYKIDPTASTIEWAGLKPTEKHTGTLNLADGTVKVQGENIESGSFTIDMNSITVTDLEGDEKASLEGHLKGEGEGKEDHFFNVAKHPTASFEITGINEKEGKTYLEGNLTIKDTKKNISFPATTSINGDTMTLDTEVFTINRTEWGVNYGSKSVFENLGDKFINDDIELKISVKANKA